MAYAFLQSKSPFLVATVNSHDKGSPTIPIFLIPQKEFEQLFTAFDEHIQISYLKSFRRVRVMFNDIEHASDAKLVLHGCTYRGCELGVYFVQVNSPIIESFLYE